MKGILAVLVTAFVFDLIAWSQSTAQADQLLFDQGVIAGGAYTNACLGFSLPIPAAFHVNQIPGVAEGKALHLPGGGLGLITILRPTEKMFGDQIFLTASDASMTSMTVQDFVGNAARRQVQADPEKRQLIHDALPAQSNGQQFFRADFKHLFTMGETQYESFMYTKFRGYFIGGTLTAGSPEALDQVAAALAQISFRDDLRNPKCTLGPDDGPRMGVIGGIISSKLGAASNSGRPPRVRVSATVSEGLVIKKVQPQYPEAARKDRIQGTVVLEASIDVNGNVEGTTLISGDALLAPSAIEAVKEWKYKPYTLNGQPAKVETQVRVVFTPPEN